MNVKELIEQLRSYPEDMEVKFAYNYGDYWKTEVAADVSNVSNSDVTYSEYHRMDRVVDEYRDDEDMDEDEREDFRKQCRTVCLLGGR